MRWPMSGHPSPEPIPQNTEPQGSLGHRNRADWGRSRKPTTSPAKRLTPTEGRNQERDGDERTRTQNVGPVQCWRGPECEPVLQVWQLGGIIGLGSPTRVVRPRLPVDHLPNAGWTARRQPTGPGPLTDPARTPTPLPIIERPTSSFLGNLQNFG